MTTAPDTKNGPGALAAKHSTGTAYPTTRNQQEGTHVSTTQSTAPGRSAAPRAQDESPQPHRYRGRLVGDLADYRPGKSNPQFMHLVDESRGPSSEDAILTGVPIQTLCGESGHPNITMFDGAGGPGMKVCPVCFAAAIAWWRIRRSTGAVS